MFNRVDISTNFCNFALQYIHGISHSSIHRYQFSHMTFLTDNEAALLTQLYRQLTHALRDTLLPGDTRQLRRVITESIQSAPQAVTRDKFGINPLIHNLRTALLLTERVSPDRNMVIAVILHTIHDCIDTDLDTAAVTAQWGDDIAHLLQGLINVNRIYHRHPAVNDDNFSHLLMTLAQDIRVIIIMIVDRLALMRAINHHPDEESVRQTAAEAGYLYAPLAHRLGLYAIKSDLEDLSLKYTNRDTYTAIAHKLNQTKVSRDKYIAAFIAPVKQRLIEAGLTFDIKGRTKSIYSIFNKIKKQRVDLDHIYDLFAIRIIIDTPLENEKRDCWLAYSIITDMFRPNPARMKDWISIPKANGYESLHITVAGPQERWVEVQIRTRRMDLIAEKGLAAHWRYKGVKSEGNLDHWMNNIRDILETADAPGGPMALMRDIKMDLYDSQVFVFTPKGDLIRLPKGATVLDFAFNIHSRLGCICTGGRVNGKHERIDYVLRSGDTVQITTASTQTPKLDWLNIAVTSKAKAKIRQTINEQNAASANLARELLLRRFKNRKIEYDEGALMRTVKRAGYKTVTDFYNCIADQTLDINNVIDMYLDTVARTEQANAPAATRSAEEFTLLNDNTDSDDSSNHDRDVLIIGHGDVKRLNYKMARCCNPIYGDHVFGFISSEGAIKIHRSDCPNATDLKNRFPYRIISVKWSGKSGDRFAATLNILGNDDIGIVTNITSMINKEKDVMLRTIAIDSNDGLFQGHLTVSVTDTQKLNALIKKLQTIKGVKHVQRNN